MSSKPTWPRYAEHYSMDVESALSFVIAQLGCGHLYVNIMIIAYYNEALKCETLCAHKFKCTINNAHYELNARKQLAACIK